MKVTFTRTMLAALAVSAAFSMNAQELKKAISFSVSPEAVGKEMSFLISALDGQTVQVDWGNGTLSDGVKVGNLSTDNEYTTLTGKIAGKDITIWSLSPQRINNIKYNATDAPITSIDLSALTGVTNIEMKDNALSSIDLTNCAKLTQIYLDNNALTSITFPTDGGELSILEASNDYDANTGTVTKGANKLVGIDWSKAPKLTEVKINGNTVTTEKADFSKCTAINKLYLTACGLTEINISGTTNLKTLEANFNQLTSFDASSMIAKASIKLNDNKLTQITLPTNTQSLHIMNNDFTLATLPRFKPTTAAYYKAAGQAPITPVVNDMTVDLSAQADVEGTPTQFVWIKGDVTPVNGTDYKTENKKTVFTDKILGSALKEGTDYTVQNGVFTFKAEVENAVCLMVNDYFVPSSNCNLILKTTPLSIKTSGIDAINADDNAPVEFYNLNGVRVNGDTPGIYIRRQGNKATKVLVK